MKIAASSRDNGNVTNFENSAYITIFDLHDFSLNGLESAGKTVTDVTGMKNHEDRVAFLKENAVDILLCSSIEAADRKLLDEAEISYVSGYLGAAEKTVETLLSGGRPMDESCSGNCGSCGGDCGSEE